MAEADGGLARLGVWDYVVFALTLVLSVGIGVGFGVAQGRRSDPRDFLTAKGKLRVLPTALSSIVSFVSAISILGEPAEMYMFNTMYYIRLLAFPLGVVATLAVVPMIYSLGLTSMQEYLELRYNSRAVKLVATVVVILTQVMFMGLAAFAPSIALQAVTGFPIWATVVVTIGVATLYTTLGGMMAVIWTDVFQSVVMFAGIIGIIIKACLEVGGIGEVWRLNQEWGKINFFDFNPDPTVRHTFWGLIISGAIDWFGMFGVTQSSVQRYCALPSLANAKQLILWNLLITVLMSTLLCLAGISVFAYYAQTGCDPLASGKIYSPNQVVAYFVMDKLAFPGFPGLFVASLFCGALSTVSSSLNALATVTWHDFLRPGLGPRLTTSQQTWVTRLLVFLYGGVGVAMSFMAEKLGGTILQAAHSFLGGAGAAVLGMFILSMLFPCPNWIGAIAGGTVALCLNMWLSIGSYSVIGAPPGLVHPVYNCPVVNTSVPPTSMSLANTTLSLATTTSPLMSSTSSVANFTSTMTLLADPGAPERSGLETFYSISYMWYNLIGIFSTIIVGLVVSFATGRMRDVNPRHLVLVADGCCCCLPEAVKRPLRCGLPYVDPQEESAADQDHVTKYALKPETNGVTSDKMDKMANGHHVTPDVELKAWKTVSSGQQMA